VVTLVLIGGAANVSAVRRIRLIAARVSPNRTGSRTGSRTTGGVRLANERVSGEVVVRGDAE
jgi:hypothetical protein